MGCNEHLSFFCLPNTSTKNYIWGLPHHISFAFSREKPENVSSLKLGHAHIRRHQQMAHGSLQFGIQQPEEARLWQNPFSEEGGEGCVWLLWKIIVEFLGCGVPYQGYASS